MRGLYLKELSAFFSSFMAYIVICTFLLMTGLLMWVFPEFSILDYPYVSMSQLFEIAPFLFMFLIPAICMHSFAEERQTGTLELLQTKPLTDVQITLAKCAANFTLILLCLIPTALYVYTLYQLGLPKGNLDLGEVSGSYIGLLFLSLVFVTIGTWASTLSKNQIVSFILASFFCFLFYMAFYLLSELPMFVGKYDAFIQYLGIDYHYSSMSRGVIDSKNIIYFITVSVLFVYLTILRLKSRRW